jgi:DNA repair protein SbcC/Rad50
MRPLRVRVKGLRSFRAEREVDFSDLSLVAIVGDTGAGKSSILEAITYALYNATTWDQRGVKQLISDGANTMSVQLDFAVDGQVYRITRSTSRGAYPPAGHALECLTDGTYARIDSEDAIKAEVARLVGLDWGGFTSAVILPQGRFQTLLQASPADKTEILKGIFRLRELAAAREHAQALATRYRDALAELQATRMRLLPDPAAAAKDAARRKREAAKEEKRLRDQRAEITKREKEATGDDEAGEKLESAADKLVEENVHPSRELKSLVPVLDELDAKAADLEQTQGDAEAAETRLKSALERAEAAGEGESQLERAKAVLERIIAGTPKLDEEQRNLADAKQTLARDESALADDERSLKKLRADADREAKALTAAEGAARKARDDLQEAKDRLVEFRHRAKGERQANEALARLERQLDGAKKRAEATEKAKASAEERLAAAIATLDGLRREHAAAHAAQGLKAGDPCPICQQNIPAGFKPPQARAEHAAQKAHEEAEAEAQQARDDRATAAATCAQLELALTDAQTKTKEATRDARAALKRAQALLGQIDPQKADADVLRDLRQAAEESDEAVKNQREVATQARNAAVAAEAALKPRRKALAERREALEQTARNLDTRAASLERDRRTLPARYQPAASASQGQRLKLLDRLDARLVELRRLRREQQALRQRLAQCRRDRDELAKRRQREFEDPRRRAEHKVLLLRKRVEELAAAAGVQAPAPPKDDAPFADLVNSLEALEQTADQVVDALRGKAREARARAKTAREAINEVLKQAGARDLDELEELLITASAEAKRAKDDEAEARRQVPIAADVDRRIVPLRDVIEVLETLASLLTDGRFIGYIVSRRQRALLGLASEILGSMTGARYGFAEDFRIIDRISGQPRNAKTLSGGETFLASLALALGLVELAARGGGRLEALFLDEGFGSLDADALDEALGELERRAHAGRLVAVISHVRAVAERIEQVLRVTRSPEGSEVTPIAGTEREEFITEEVEEGLLA